MSLTRTTVWLALLAVAPTIASAQSNASATVSVSVFVQRHCHVFDVDVQCATGDGREPPPLILRPPAMSSTTAQIVTVLF
jgi:hypothetical protein